MSAIEKETALMIQNIVRNSGWIELPAEGNSMYPFIHHGDVCRFLSCDPFLLKKGDVVLFYLSSGQLIAHRFYQARTSQNRPEFFFKGDTNLGFDEPIAEEQIIGKLASIQRGRVIIRVGNFPAFLWGKLMLTFPNLSGLLRGYLNRRPIR